MTGVAGFRRGNGSDRNVMALVMVASDDVAEQDYRQVRPVIGCGGILTDTLRVMLPRRM